MNKNTKLIYSPTFICGAQRLPLATPLEEGVQTSVIKTVVEPTTPARDLMDSLLTVVMLAFKETHVRRVSKVKKKNYERKRKV